MAADGSKLSQPMAIQRLPLTRPHNQWKGRRGAFRVACQSPAPRTTQEAFGSWAGFDQQGT